jgi:hypothetical protein
MLSPITTDVFIIGGREWAGLHFLAPFELLSWLFEV